MPDTFTPNLNLTQPEVGASNDTWGTKLNADMASLDALFATSGTGVVTRHDANDNAATSGLTIAKAAGNTRFIQFLTGAVATTAASAVRWLVGATSAAESGSNAGSDWNLQRYSDTGVLLGTSIAIARATGQVTFETTPQVGSNTVRTAANDGDLRTLVGAVQWWAGSGDPAGGYWLVCDGRALDRTTYAALYAVCGTTYGAGNGVTTFNIPNLAERVIVGKAPAQSLIPQYNCTVLGAAIGEGKHTLTLAEAPMGQFTFNWSDLGHSHTEQFANGTGGAGAGAQNINSTGAVSASGPSTSTNQTGITASITDHAGGQAHNIVQPGLVLTPIIRVQ